MTRRTYVVVRGSKSACGIHPDTSMWRRCPDCDRAAALTAAALAHVVPRRAEASQTQRRLTREQIDELHARAARGETYAAIASALGVSDSAVSRHVSGLAGHSSAAKARARHNEFMPLGAADRAHRQAIPPMRGTR